MSSNYAGSQTSSTKEGLLGEIRSYGEVLEFLSSRRLIDYNEMTLRRMRELDAAFDNVISKLDVILIGGCNGKSTTINFTNKLLNTEGLKVGVAYSSHFLIHNERISVDEQVIGNRAFSEVVNDVINVVEEKKIDSTAFEILTMSAFLHFRNEKVDVVLLEVGLGGKFDATNICNPKVSAVTKVAEDNVEILSSDLDKAAREMVGIARKDGYFISAEQSKIRLQKMKKWVEECGATWVMPIRKLASLPYIYEQLYGKSASLAERIAQLYIEEVRGQFSPFLRGNLLATLRGQRGRPTLEAKRQAELNPVKSLKSFWNEEFKLLRGRFELLDKEKPTTLLDNAHNIDAIESLFLGIRLLHYQRPLKGLALVMGLKDFITANEIMKHIRYLFKRVGGQVFFVPLKGDANCLNPSDLVEVARGMNIKAKGYNTFTEAFEEARTVVDERQGLLCVSGHTSLISEYWREKGIKKF